VQEQARGGGGGARARVYAIRGGGEAGDRRKIRMIECNVKCRYLEKLKKGLCGRCFICLRPPPPL
jgi:hypothetical protein